ncbi:MAG: hypothetical protein GX434_07565 [Peptococcaceae bacterium]|nr:hypothetical protein [Peptococcaceae bacterium]
MLPLVLIALLLSASVFTFFSLIKKDVPAYEDLPALKAIDKVRKAEKLGGTVELSETEVNSIVKFYAAKVLASQQNIKEVNIKLLDKGIAFFAPASYLSSIEVVLHSKGNLSSREGSIIYQPQGFWAGSVPLPKSMISYLLSKIAAKGITIEEGNLVLDKEFIPFAIAALDITEGKMTIGFNKSTPSSAIAQSNTDSSNGTPSNNNLSASAIQNNASKDTGNNKPAQPADPPKVSDETKKELLQQVNGQLSVVLGKVKTAGEKAIISTIRGVVSKMTANPSYPFQAEAQSVKAMYSKLSPEEKTDLKQVMLSNMNVDTLVEVKKVFGL